MIRSAICTLAALLPQQNHLDELEDLLNASDTVADFEDLRLQNQIHAARLRPFKYTETDDSSDDQ